MKKITKIKKACKEIKIAITELKYVLESTKDKINSE